MRIDSIFMAAILGAAILPAETKEFEVASIKQNKINDGRVSIQITPGGRWKATGVPMNLLLQIAYDLRPSQLTGGPAWLGNESYDIEAKLDGALGPNPKPEEMRPYLQNLLEKRFQLKYHRESKEMTVYTLVTSKGGPKMKESAPETQGPRIRMGRGQITVTKANMDMLARELSRMIGRSVLNETELKGNYDFDLTWTPDGSAGPPPVNHGPEGSGGPPAPGGDGPTIFTAVQEQLGLKLESKKAQVDMFVIDKAEKPEEN